MAGEKRDNFQFTRLYYEAIEQISSEADKNKMYKSIIEYALDGTEPELEGSLVAIFSLVRPSLDLSRKKAEAGRAGGSKSKKTGK